jgi:hypothetical protein
VYSTLKLEREDAVTVTLNLRPEIEAGLLAQAQAAGMSIEEYLQQLVEKEVPAPATEFGHVEESGMVWEDGLLTYGAGTALPAGFIDDALRRSREERSQHILGNHS